MVRPHSSHSQGPAVPCRAVRAVTIVNGLGVAIVSLEAVGTLAWWAHDSAATFGVGANIAQLISVISLPLAAWAIVSAKRDLASERRLSFELDVLRDLAEVHSLQFERDKIRALLLLIPGSEDLRLTRAAAYANASPEALQDYRQAHPDAPDGDPADHWATYSARLTTLGWPAFHKELLAAIDERIGGQS